MKTAEQYAEEYILNNYPDAKSGEVFLLMKGVSG